MDFGVRKFRELLFVATCGMGAEFLLALADTVIAGNIVGETALAGINLLQPVFNLVQFTAALIGTGTAIRFSLETGRLDTRRASEMFSQGFWSVLLFGSVLFIAFVFGREAFLGFFGAADSATEAARTYWKWYAPCTILLPMTLYLIALVYADGDMVACAWGYGSLILGNIIVSFCLCHLMGIAGCALGTVIGNILAIVSLSSHFIKKSNMLKLVGHFKLRDLVLVCKSSFADASVSLCWSLLFFLLAKLVVVEFGSDMLPVLSVVLVCINLTLLFNGVSAAAQPIVGIYFGEKNMLSVRKVMKDAMKVAFAEGVFAAILFAVFPELAVRMVGIDEPEHIIIATKAVRLVAIGFIGAPFVFLFNSYYLFVERYTLACTLTFVADILIYAILCPPFAHFAGLTGLWVSLGIAPVVAVALFGLFVALIFGRKRFPLLLSAARERNQYAYGFKVDATGIEMAGAQIAEALTRRNMGGFAAEARRITIAIFTSVLERNKSRKVIGEAGFDLSDGVRLCLRDDGVIVDLSSTVAHVRGRHFVTMGYNRNLFELLDCA